MVFVDRHDLTVQTISMKRLYFARHGLSEMNVSGHIAGHTNTPLVAEGRQQAKKAGKAAKNLGIDLIVASPLSRALDTAKIIAKEIGYKPKDIKVNELLVERFHGSMEGQPWSPDLNLDGFSDVETIDSLLSRAKKALEWIDSLPGDNVLVVSHGGFGRALRHYLKPDYDLYEQIPNAEIVCWVED